MSDSDSLKNTSEMLEVFFKDLQTLAPLIVKKLRRITEDSLTNEEQKELNHQVRNLLGAAKLIQLHSIEAFFDFLKDELQKTTQKDRSFWIDSIKQSIQILENVKSVKKDDIELFFEGKVPVNNPLPIKSIVEVQKDKDLPEEGAFLDLFIIELEAQTSLLNEELVKGEQHPQELTHFESMMRAAHSIKGAAKVVSLDPIVRLAHAMEDCFVAAQQNRTTLTEEHYDVLFQAIDFLIHLKTLPKPSIIAWLEKEHQRINELIQLITSIGASEASQFKDLHSSHFSSQKRAIELSQEIAKKVNQDRILRVSAQNLNRLMGLAGESMVESRWLNPFGEALIKLKKLQSEVISDVDALKEALKDSLENDALRRQFELIQQKLQETKQSLSDRLSDLDLFISRHSSLTDRLYTEVIESRMRPFSDLVEGMPRMVRDLSRQLNKKVRLNIIGKSTSVDRDILEKLESPLNHLIRNAIDHGIETPEERERAGKTAEGTITIEARHRAGLLVISVTDDGRGIDLRKIKQTIIQRNLIKSDMADHLNESELLEFLFLPGFTTAPQVTEISGRGIGLNIVQNMIQEVTGTVHVVNHMGKGLSIYLHLPLTLSVIRALIVDISGEPYAFPLARLEQAITLPKEQLRTIENRQYFTFEGKNIGIVPACQVLEICESSIGSKILSIIILGDRSNLYGLVVDRFMGEREMVVHELDHRLGKIPNISAGSLLEDGEPVFIIDVEDVVLSIDQLLSGGRLKMVAYEREAEVYPTKRILVVDDSLTVREVECRLLRNQGFEVETAVNGIDGWNAARIGNYDLVITDVDMPRMNGIELVRNIKNDPRLKATPVMIVSYKEREGDRLLGLEAGANYYLTKSSFHDETLLNAVFDLIGRP